MWRRWAQRCSGSQGGLGLVRHLVEAHGGTVHAESAGKGKGATFTVLIPLMAARGVAEEEPREPGQPAATTTRAHPPPLSYPPR